MANTTHRNWPLPDVADDIDVEFYRLRDVVLPAIDLDMQSLFDALGGKADANHGHAIADIEGLATALDGMMPANTTFTLAGLSDVAGAAAAPDGYVLVKQGAGWVVQSALSAVGAHNHTIAQVTGLTDALTGKKDNASEWFGTQAAYDAIATPDPNVTYFIFE